MLRRFLFASLPVSIIASKSDSFFWPFSDSRNFISSAVEKVLPSVVNISSSQTISSGLVNRKLITSGSGFVVKNGVILTNAHVVSDIDDKKIIVMDSNGVSHPATLFSIDYKTDLAIIKINDTSINWKPVVFGDCLKLKLGDWAIAIGSPFNLHNTVTVGVISCIRRLNSQIGHSARSRLESKASNNFDFIQTDCAIHSGSSGIFY